MKRLMLFSILFFSIIESYAQEEKWHEVALTNQATFPIELHYYKMLKGGSEQEPVIQEILPNKTVVVKVVKGLNANAKISYRPLVNDKQFKQQFPIDLPNSKSFVFTATRLGDIMNNILVPGVFTADDKGATSFQYMNIGDPKQWDAVLSRAGRLKEVK